MNAVGKSWCVLVLAAFGAGCDGGTDASVATTVTATSPTSQTAVTGTSVAQPPAVRVLDQRGDPMGGVSVTFTANASGTLTSSTATTDAGGNASAGGWTLGPTAGTQSVKARVGSLAPVTFTATAQARVPATITAVTPTSQTGIAGRTMNLPPVVKVIDQTGQPLDGALVTFAVTEGNGMLGAPHTVTTGPPSEPGLAVSGFWRLGSEPGRNVVTVTVAGLAPIQFEATGHAPVATTMSGNTPNIQFAAPGAAVSFPPSVTVYDQAGQPLAGVEVTFSVTAGGGALTGATATTNESGVATTSSWTLGPAEGENVAAATAVGLWVHFHATAQVPVATNIFAISPISQSAPVGTDVPEPPSVRVTDQQGRVLPGVPVTFTVTAGGGAVTGAIATTNGLGVATVGRWTLGPAEGQNTLTATAGSLSPVTFNGTGTPGGAP